MQLGQLDVTGEFRETGIQGLSANIVKANAVKIVGAEDSVEVVLRTAAEIDSDSARKRIGFSIRM